MIEIDKISQLVSSDTDIAMGDLEKLVAREGYTLNYFAAPHNRAILAEVLEQRIPNAYAECFGGIEDLCVQALWSQPDGTVYRNVLAPRSATGPDFNKLAIGAGGALGIPIQATLKLFRVPPVHRVVCAVFPDLKHLNLFRRALAKLPFRLPLVRPLPGRLLKELWPEAEPGSLALGMALWGEGALVNAQLEWVVAEAERKKAELVSVEDEALQKKAGAAMLEAPTVPDEAEEENPYGDEDARKKLERRIMNLR
jgi:FAD/FMN-containing dehydrogenases